MGITLIQMNTSRMPGDRLLMGPGGSTFPSSQCRFSVAGEEHVLAPPSTSAHLIGFLQTQSSPSPVCPGARCPGPPECKFLFRGETTSDFITLISRSCRSPFAL